MQINQNEFRQFLPLVNDELFATLQIYANWRITQLRYHLDAESDLNMIYRLQGQIQELKRFKTLRDEVLEGSK